MLETESLVVAIVDYRVRPEVGDDFLTLIHAKWAYQTQEGYIEDGARLAKLSGEGLTFTEVFTWTGTAHLIKQAHQDGRMDQLWNQLDEATVGGRWEGITIKNGVWV